MMLPAPPKKLFGRENDLKHLMEAWENHTSLYVYGPGGVGKTALVSKLVMEQRKKHKLPVFYINIHQKIELNSFLSLFLSQFQTSLGLVEIQKTESNQDLLHQIVTLVNDHPQIIIIDNLHHLDSDNGSILLQYILHYTFDCQLCIISREKPPLLEAHIPAPFVYILKGMTTDNISEILQNNHFYAADIKRTSEYIFGISEGNPLLIQQLVLFMKREAVEPDDLQVKEVTLWKFLLHHLDKRQKHILNIFSFIPNPLSATEIIFSRIDSEIIEKLSQQQFLIKEPSHRYIIHDVLKEYIIRSLSVEERQEYAEIVLKYYCELLKLADSTNDAVLSILLNIRKLFIYIRPSGIWEESIRTSIITMIQFGIGFDAVFFYESYHNLFGYNRELLIQLNIYLFEDEQTHAAIKLFRMIPAAILEDKITLDDNTFQYLKAVANYYISTDVKEKNQHYESKLMLHLNLLLQTNQTSLLFQRLKFYCHLLERGASSQFIQQYKQFILYLYSFIENKSITIKNDFERLTLLYVYLMHYQIDIALSIRNTISSQWYDQCKNISQQNEAVKILWFYHFLKDDHEQSIAVTDKMYHSRSYTMLSLVQQMYFLYIRALSLWDSGKYDAVLNMLPDFHQIIQSNPSIDNIERYYKILGNIYFSVGWYKKAADNLMTATQLVRAEDHLKMMCYRLLARCHDEKGDLQNALSKIRACFSIERGKYNKDRLVSVQLTLVKVLTHHIPRKGIHKLLDKIRNNRNDRLVFNIQALQIQADLYMKLKEFSHAENCIHQAMQISQEKKLIYQKKICLELYLKYYWSQKDFEKYQQTLHKLEDLWIEMGNKYIPSKIHFYKAVIAVAYGYFEFAISELQNGYKLSKEFGHETLSPFYAIAMQRLINQHDKTKIQLLQTSIIETQNYLLTEPKSLQQLFLQELQFFGFDSAEARISSSNKNISFDGLQDIQLQPSKSIYINKDLRILRIAEKNTQIAFQGKKKLFELFCCLAEAFPETVSIENCFIKIWKFKFSPALHTNNVHVAIKRLRFIINQIPGIDEIIITTQDGYRLNDNYKFQYIEKKSIFILNQRQKDFISQQQLILSKTQYIERYKISAKTAYNDLQQLLQAGIIVAKKGQHTIYYQANGAL